MADNKDPVEREIRRKKVQRSITLLAELQGLKKTINLVDDNNEEGEDWQDEQILLLKPEKLMSDILDRIEALNVVQGVIKETRAKLDDCGEDDEEINEEDSKEDEENAVVCKTFVAAVSMSLSKFGQSHWEKKDDSHSLGTVTCSILSLLHAFPDETKMKDGRNALLTHWAMLAVARPEYGVTEADVKALVKRDPMSMQTHHMTGMLVSKPGLTPAHFLCMQQETDSVMALIRHYAIYNEKAFTMCSSCPRDDSDEADYSSALHAACNARLPSVEFLQLLLQLDPSQAKKASQDCFTPLGDLCHDALCYQQEGTEFNDAIHCLLAVDNSAEYVGEALCGLLYGACRSEGWAIEEEVASMQEHILTMMDMLLARNTDAAKYRSNGWNLLHHIASVPSTMPSQLCIIIMQRILTWHADAVREWSDSGFCLPVHLAADNGRNEVMEFMLGLYPESAAATNGTDPNILTYLLRRKNEGIVVVDLVSKVRFLCSRYPQLLQQKDDNGNNALFWELAVENFRLPVVKILCEAGGRELVSAARISPLPVDEGADQEENMDDGHGWLPLHGFFYSSHAKLRNCLPFSDEAECLRMLLHWYPEAVGIVAGVGDARMTPYQLAVGHNVDPYYLRMLLRALPDLNPADLHRLNYAERRMAMFLAFKAISTDDHMLLPRLRFANKDLLKRVISFL